MSNRRRKKTPLIARISPTGAAAIIVMGIFVMCLVVLISKAVFVSNSKDVPEGMDTATIGTGTQASLEDISQGGEQTSGTTAATTADTSKQSSESTTKESESTTAQTAAKMKTVDVTYLKEQPDENSADVIVMSPNIEVDVLEVLDNGWTKVTFLNVTGQLTGYILSSYLY